MVSGDMDAYVCAVEKRDLTNDEIIEQMRLYDSGTPIGKLSIRPSHVFHVYRENSKKEVTR